ncbi:MAG TPA: UDP-N-acetylmuramoyl-L-alanyl-D-glutamate--2,6-diaminopimelate ligase, partial [Rikenellaceae bacterium]|nr:UDP-N-acetylmuramoyl-L-alanyl-D-glutamate--2,6-diaminopimelate ligase [Rikenellaceae bacterium]
MVIDYAHTPDALENVLKTLRDVGPEKQLICLFGCGGDRDKTKRPEMGA